MSYKFKRLINSIKDKVGMMIFFIVGAGLIFGGVMLFTVEKSIVPLIPIVMGLAILSVVFQNLFGRYIKGNFGTQQFIYCFIILVILVFVGVFLSMVTTNLKVMINGEITTAQITGMRSNGIPLLDYVANGEKYTNVYLGTSSPGMARGDWIKVAYYPENPGRVYHCGASAFAIPVGGLLVFGSALLFVIWKLVRSIKKKVEKISFANNSKIVWGVVDKMEQNMGSLGYDDSIWFIHCSYKEGDVTFKCKSKALKFNPDFCYNVGDPIEIRVDYEDFTNYEVIVDMTRMASMTTEY